MSYADLKPVRFDENYGQQQSYYISPSHHQPLAPSTPIQQPPLNDAYCSPTYINLSTPQAPVSTLSTYYPNYQHYSSPMVQPNPMPMQSHFYHVQAHEQHPHTPQPIQQQTPHQHTHVFNTPKQRSMAHNQQAQKMYGSSASKMPVNDDELSEDLRNHWLPMTWLERSADDSGVFSFVCLWGSCVDSCMTKNEFVRHLTYHVEQVAADADASLGGHPDSFTCKVRGCLKKLPRIDELRRHITMHIFQADCQQKGSEALIEKDDYSGIECCGFEPSANVHYDGEVLVCQWETCGIPFCSLTDLFDHVYQHIDYMSEPDKLEQVLEGGDKRSVFPCRWIGCSQAFDSKPNLRRHIRHHSGEKVLACPFCAKFFSRKDKLYDHCIRRTILLKEAEDPYVCKLCQKAFGTEKALCMHVTRHLVSHSCPLCGLAVTTRYDLHRHLMTKHSSRTKDFKCETCNKCFFSESELSRHAIIHSDTTYNCKHCPEKFKWKKQLMKHIKEHDENFNPSPFVCHFCEKSYTTGFALGRHLSKTHKCQVPYGFSRFTYKKCEDGLMRLQTKKLFRTEGGWAA